MDQLLHARQDASQRPTPYARPAPWDREGLFRWLRARGADSWADQVAALAAQRYHRSAHGDWPKWLHAIDALPPPEAAAGITVTGGAVTITAAADPSAAQIDSTALRKTLMQLHPWRKGPFRFFDIHIDTEWRSDWKWARIENAVDWAGKSVLDIGCGNGYYGWRMLERGAEIVVGCDPLLLYNVQFEAVRRYWQQAERFWVVPIKDMEISPRLHLFDIVVSMGVLYHRSSPIEHLMRLRDAARPGGTVLIETLVIDTDQPTVLVPQQRYAKMRNVWFIPSPPMMETWLHRCGFQDIRCVDVTRTELSEQRRTEWMQFESLADFLDPRDMTKTIEGYPAPVRGIWTARA